MLPVQYIQVSVFKNIEIAKIHCILFKYNFKGLMETAESTTFNSF